MNWDVARLLVLLVPLSLLLNGCATSVAPPAEAVIAPDLKAVARTYTETLNISGRLSVQHQRGVQPEALHGNFSWSQKPAHTMITLLSPLGQTLAEIDVTPEVSTLVQAGQAPRRAADVDTLIAETLGWPLPVAGLRDWLQGFGVDAAGQRFVAQASASPFEIVTRDGWQITFSSWQSNSADASKSHPKRIDLARSTPQAGDVAIRIVIDDWH